MKQKAILVIGMHRSGTSALSGLLDEMGVFMGKSLFSAQKGVNEKGFFENSALVSLNEKLLDATRWSWDDPLAECIDAHGMRSLVNFEYEANDVLHRDYENRECWGMKDPRTTLLLPFWKKIVAAKPNLETSYILMVRSPFEVFGSLNKRDGFSLEKSLMLWMNYTLSGYFNTLDQKCQIVAYDRLLEEPSKVAVEIASNAGLQVDFDESALSFVDKKLRNQNIAEVPSSHLVTLATSLYHALVKEVVPHDDVIEINNQYQLFLQSLSEVLKEHLSTVKQDEVYYRQLFLSAYKSYWWKLSWPMKKIEHILRGKA